MTVTSPPGARAVALFVLALSIVAGFSGACAHAGGRLRSSLFLGPRADHFLDRSGALGIDADTSNADGIRFTPVQTRERRLRAAAQASEARFRSFAGSASDSFWRP